MNQKLKQKRRVNKSGYYYLFRGTPLLVQIFIIYFGLGQIEYLRTTFLWTILKEPYWCAIIAFALNTGAYTSEILSTLKGAEMINDLIMKEIEKIKTNSN